MNFDAPLYIIATAIIGLNILPGPTMVYVAHQTMHNGLRNGLWSIMGVQVGILLHIFASVLGLSLLILHSDSAFKIIRYLGACFLIYLSISILLKSKKDTKSLPAITLRKGNWSSFLRGAAINALNPKVVIYFILLVPQFVSAHSSNMTAQIIILGLAFLVACSCMNLAISFSVFATVKNRLNGHPTMTKWMNRITSLVFICFGIGMLFFHK